MNTVKKIAVGAWVSGLGMAYVDVENVSLLEKFMQDTNSLRKIREAVERYRKSSADTLQCYFVDQEVIVLGREHGYGGSYSVDLKTGKTRPLPWYYGLDENYPFALTVSDSFTPVLSSDLYVRYIVHIARQTMAIYTLASSFKQGIEILDKVLERINEIIIKLGIEYYPIRVKGDKEASLHYEGDGKDCIKIDFLRMPLEAVLQLGHCEIWKLDVYFTADKIMYAIIVDGGVWKQQGIKPLKKVRVEFKELANSVV